MAGHCPNCGEPVMLVPISTLAAGEEFQEWLHLLDDIRVAGQIHPSGTFSTTELVSWYASSIACTAAARALGVGSSSCW